MIRNRAPSLFARLLCCVRSKSSMFLIIGLVATSCAEQPYDPTPGVAELNRKAQAELKAGHFVEATSLEKRAVALDEAAFGLESLVTVAREDLLSTILRTSGDYVAAESIDKKVLSSREALLGPDDPKIRSGLGNLALDYEFQGRYSEAVPLFRRAVDIAERKNDEASIELGHLGELYRKDGRFSEAEPFLKRSLALMESISNPTKNDIANTSFALSDLADDYADQHRAIEAEALYLRAEDLAESKLGHDSPVVLGILGQLYVFYYHQNRVPAVEAILKRLTVENKTTLARVQKLVQWKNDLANLYVNENRLGEAEIEYKSTLALRERANGHDDPSVARTLADLAELERRRADPAAALAYSRGAVAILEKRFQQDLGNGASGAEEERHGLTDIVLQNILFLHTTDAAGSVDETFRNGQLTNTSSAAQAIAGTAARFASGSDALARVVRERQDLLEHWRQLDQANVRAEGQARPGQDLATLRTELATTGQQLNDLDARIARDFPSYAELSNPQPLAVKVAQKLLAPDEALLTYLVGPDQSWLWVVRPQQATLIRIDMTVSALDAAVKVLRRRLDPEINQSLEPFPATKANDLYEKIFAPAIPFLANVHHLLIVPSGALESLPFEVLVKTRPPHDPQTPADHRSVAWLARDYAMSVLPSVASLRALRVFGVSTRSPMPFVGIGDPVLDGAGGTSRGVTTASLFRGGLADVDAVRQLPPLPETANELRAVAATLGAHPQDLYLAQRASEPLIRAAGLDRYRVIEFATHGLMSGDLQGLAEPALVLTPPAKATPDDDGLLTASKIATLKLNAEWIVLSSCNTAAGDGTPDAGGLSGLAKAFFYAGSRSLLVSHWEVSSDATVKLVTGAIKALAQHPAIGRAEALRRSELAMMEPSNPPAFSHPALWAPFILAGEGASGH